MEDYGHSNYKLFLSGDPSGFESIVKQYRGNLILFIAQYVDDFQAAEDISQDVFVKIYLGKPHCSTKASFKTWLYTIAKNEALNYLKKHKRDAAPNLEKIESIREDYINEIIKDEEKKALHSALSELPCDYRRVLYLKFFEDFSVGEIAATLKKTPRQTSDLIYNAKKALAAIIMNGGKKYEILRPSSGGYISKS